MTSRCLYVADDGVDLTEGIVTSPICGARYCKMLLHHEMAWDHHRHDISEVASRKLDIESFLGCKQTLQQDPDLSSTGFSHGPNQFGVFIRVLSRSKTAPRV